MAITGHTLDLAAQAKAHTTATVDAYTYQQIRAWAQAWDDIAAEFDAELARLQKLGRFADAMDTERLRQLQQSMSLVIDRRLAELINETGAQVGATNRQLANQTVADMADVLRSQVDPSYWPGFIRPVPQATLDWVADRATQQITVRNYFLQADATKAMKRELMIGLAAGDNPNDAARRMIRRVEGEFNGGLTRATVISRTEMLDATRHAALEQRKSNADILDGWIWHADLSSRTCPACWSLHGSVHPVEEAGPIDHHQGRCTALPKTKSAEELGLAGGDVPGLDPTQADAQAKFETLPESVQREILGPARFEAWKSGQYPMSSWAQRVEHYETVNGQRVQTWRDSMHVSNVPKTRPQAGPVRASGDPAPSAPVTVRGDRGYRGIADPSSRATRFLQDHFETERAGKKAAANIARGVSPLDGIELDEMTPLITNEYTWDALRDDITRAGRFLAGKPSAPAGTRLFKGMSDVDELRLDVEFWSMTTDKKIARRYALNGKPGPVLVELLDGHGIELPKVGSFHQETLVAGRLEILDDRVRDGWRYVKARWHPK